MTTTKRWSQRSGNRGVAMVEAGILAPVFAMMMMMTVYLMGTYETKYRTVMLSRYATWSYATNGCKDDAYNPMTSDLPPGITLGGVSNAKGDQMTNEQDEQGGTGGNTDATKYTSGADGAGGASARASMFMSKGTATMTWTYTPGVIQKFTGHDQPITTDSQTLCGPVKSGMNPFDFITSIKFP